MHATQSAVAAVLASLASLVAIASASDTQVLVIHSDSLTSVKFGSATPVQNARPIHLQRGVGIDGTPRLGSVFGWSLAGNASGEPVGATASLSGLSLSTGAWSVTDVDLALPAERPWVVGRSYNARQRTSGDAHHDSNGYQGRNWFQMCQPEIVLYDDQDDALDVLYLVYGADRFVEFRRVDLGEETYSSTTWRAVNGAAGLFEHTRDTGSGPDTWTYYDSAGSTAVFFGFDDDDGGSSPDAAGAAGQLWKASDPAGNTAYVGHETTISTAISNGYDGSGRILEAFDSAGRRYCYTYSTIDSVTRLTQVIAETDAGGGWGDCGTETLVGKVEYAYYQTGDNTYGDNGCLKLVTVTTPLTDSGVSLVAKTYYRYWKGEFNDSTNPGHPYALQYVVSAEGYRRADWQDATFDDDPLTMTETNLKPYASASFEYDSSHRVDKAWFNGECGCSGGLNGTYELAYETDDDYTDTSGYQSAWARRTVVERPDVTYETRYFDETGQALSRVVTDAHPGNTNPAPSAWATKIVRDASGLVTHVHTPANENGYAHDDVNGPDGTITSHTTAGLIRYYPRAGSGDLTGFLDGERWKVGTTTTDANSTWSWSVDRNKKSKTVGDGTVHNPYVEKRRLYYTATTSKGTLGTGNASNADVDGYTGNPLVTEVMTSTQPSVPTGENGSGSGNAVSTYFNPDARPAFTKSATGIIGYRAYNGLGLVATSVADADTGETGSGEVFEGVTIPQTPVDFDSRGTPLHEVTRYTYDAQGRPDETTLPDGRVTKRYYTKLADGRLVTVSIPKYVSGTGTFHGPASYTVTNLAGKGEFSGTIALTTTTTALSGWIDETKADPVEALGVGSLSGVTTSVYDAGGTRLDESRAYFDIPGSPNYLPGTAGTHYDATLYGYDDMGRRRRVKDATGTIHRTGFDVLGRAVESWVGTNDSSFAGGEPSGTDNMVKTEVREYDGGSAGGNSLLTKVKRDADGNWGTTTDQRVTEFLHDARGRVVVTLNPLAPHSLVKYDEQGNVTAAAAYSATSGLDAGDDPTTLATNRVSLSTTLFDVLGRAYESRQYKINQSNGAVVQESSNDVYIRGRTWYDPEGRVMKSVGATISKTRHDRLGRATHQWTIADDDDTQYGHASESTAIWNTTDYQTSAAGDIVVTESRTTFEALTGHVIMTAVIERLFDDRDTGETTGPLDTNADGDDLLYTAANVKGRIRITGMWHDELGRLTDTVEFGTYGGSNFDRDGLSAPARSDTALRTTITYNSDGTRLEVEDPAGTKTRWVYDDARRVVTEIGNYVNGTPSGATGDDDHHVRHVYTNGLRTRLWVDLDGDGTEDADDQVTVYTYGVSTSDTPGASQVASNGLLRQVTYPDSASSDDVVRFAYNALGEVVWTRDQAGTVVETDYDLAGRVLHRRATATGSGIDTAVLRISTAYTARGQVDTVTQHTSATVGSGSVVDEVEYAYDEWGQVTAFDQDWNSAVGASGSVDDLGVGYTHALALSQGSGVYRALRTTGTTLPDTTAVAYTYDSSDGRHDADLGRVSRVQVGATDAARYEYNGLATLVGTELLEAELLYTRYDLNGDFTRIDRFGRVTEDIWSRGIDTGGSPAYDVYRDLYDVDIAWDRASNVTRVEDNVYDGWDVGYALDGRDRLTRAERGTWGGSSIGSLKQDERWTLTQTGNWDLHRLDLNGDGDFIDTGELDDRGTFNVVNEQTARDIDDDTTDEFTLTYDAAGHLTDDGENYEYVYDAWGRLRFVKDTSDQSVVAEYTYNGLGYRIGWHYDVDADGTVEANTEHNTDDPWFHFVYDTSWRIVAVYRVLHWHAEGGWTFDADPKERFVYHNAGLAGGGGSSYIDAVILRDRDANTAWEDQADGTLEERVYYCQNWRADVVALFGSNGHMLQQVRYDPYGVPFGISKADLTADGVLDSADSSLFVTLYNSGSGTHPFADWNLDGTLNSQDPIAYLNSYNADVALGYGVLSYAYARAGGANRKAYAGYEIDPVLTGANGRESVYHVRHRVLLSELGRWNRRDPLGYVDGPNVLIMPPNPITSADPSGLTISTCCEDAEADSPAFRLGVVICCYGEQATCVFTERIDIVYPCGNPNGTFGCDVAKTLIAQCIQVHENDHLDDPCTCDDIPGYSRTSCDPNKWDRAVVECSAYKAEQKCLQDAFATCDSLINKIDIMTCKHRITDALHDVNVQIDFFCNAIPKTRPVGS